MGGRAPNLTYRSGKFVSSINTAPFDLLQHDQKERYFNCRLNFAKLTGSIFNTGMVFFFSAFTHGVGGHRHP